MASSHYGLGSGTPEQELTRWLREAGRVTVHLEGTQNNLFTNEPTVMYRLYNRKGESWLVTTETAERFGLVQRPMPKPQRKESTPDLFNTQGGLF